jgi:hypothetical protein
MEKDRNAKNTRITIPDQLKALENAALRLHVVLEAKYRVNDMREIEAWSDIAEEVIFKTIETINEVGKAISAAVPGVKFEVV